MMWYYATFHLDGSVTFRGINWSNKSPLMRVEVDAPKDVVVIKHPGGKCGGKCWAGNYVERSIVPVSILLFRIIEKRGDEVTLEPLAAVKLRAKALTGGVDWPTLPPLKRKTVKAVRRIKKTRTRATV